MKIELQFETQDVYDEKANVTFDVLPQKSQDIEKRLNRTFQQMEDIVSVKTSDTEEKTNINTLGERNDDYVRVCRRAWDRLWKYFGVEEFKEKCFPSKRGLSLTSQEEEFLKRLFDNSAFMDGRVKKLEESEKESVQWAARNLYQMIRRRIGVSEEIRQKFYDTTKDKSYIREKKFNEISECIGLARQLAFDESSDNCLNIKEKELWTESLIGALADVIKKWNNVYNIMGKLKCADKNKYGGIIYPEELLKNAIKEVNKD